MTMLELKEKYNKKGIKIMTGTEAMLEQRVIDLEMEVANLKADMDALMGRSRARTELDEEYAKAVWASIRESEVR